MRASFDELAPEPVSLNVPAEGRTVAALYFETDRAPYVVKVAEGGAVQREVPWREATGVKSASRSQLLRLLVPLQNRPTIEVVGAILRIESAPERDHRKFDQWSYFVAVFLTQPGDQLTVIPSHRTKVGFSFGRLYRVGPFRGPDFRAEKNTGISVGSASVSIRGSGIFALRESFQMERGTDRPSLGGTEALLELEFGADHVESPLKSETVLQPRDTDPLMLRWGIGN